MVNTSHNWLAKFSKSKALFRTTNFRFLVWLFKNGSNPFLGHFKSQEQTML